MTRVLGSGWALPALDDWNRDFFTAGVLKLQQCRGCLHIQHPPEEVCESCQGDAFTTFESAGTGRVESVAVVHHPVHPALSAQVPYAVVLVSVHDAPGILITGNVVGSPPGDVRIGNAVRVVFESEVDPNSGVELKIPQWEVISD
jgi:hypothetical protein